MLFRSSFVGSTKIELSEVVVEPGNAIVITKIIIAADPLMPHPIKIFFCDERFFFGFAGSVIAFQQTQYAIRLKLIIKIHNVHHLSGSIIN